MTFVLDFLASSVDMFWPEFGASDAEADGSLSVLLVVGIVVCMFKSFGFFIALCLKGQP